MDVLKLQDELIRHAYGRFQPANITAQLHDNAVHPDWLFSLRHAAPSLIPILYPKARLSPTGVEPA
jgi:hypothetical protein